MLILALVAGLVGGVVSSQFLMGQNAFAKKKAKPPEVIKAQRILIVDENGVERASFGLADPTTKPIGLPKSLHLSMKDENEVIRLQASVALDGMPQFQLIDKNKNPRIMLAENKNDVFALMVAGVMLPKNCGNSSVIAAGRDWTSMNILDGDCNRIWKAP